MGKMTAMQTSVMTATNAMRWRWNRRYWTASSPHFWRNWSSVILKIDTTHAKRLWKKLLITFFVVTSQTLNVHDILHLFYINHFKFTSLLDYNPNFYTMFEIKVHRVIRKEYRFFSMNITFIRFRCTCVHFTLFLLKDCPFIRKKHCFWQTQWSDGIIVVSL